MADKDQCKTKYSRLPYEYDVFKWLCDLSGGGWNSEINAPMLDHDTWASLTKTQPRNASLLKRFREEGFSHTNVCSVIAGDSRATAAEAVSLEDFVNNEAAGLLHSSAEVQTESRTDRIKRYRDGRLESSNNKAQANNDQMASFLKTAEQYFQMKMELLARELGEQDGRETSQLSRLGTLSNFVNDETSLMVSTKLATSSPFFIAPSQTYGTRRWTM
ncbi:hypothetical protein GQ600_11416 [Phytophthora cactorum]|nr:hypothetical protein GQ600_11416 [Phytophthora cactorum]